MRNAIYTFGYEGTKIAEFVKRLQSLGIQLIVDVRSNPISRKPGFSKKAFTQHITTSDMEYVHYASMGCPKNIRDNYKKDNDWLRYTNSFLKYLDTQEVAVNRLADIVGKKNACLVCFEADHNTCHRTFVARALREATNQAIYHITMEKVLPDERAFRPKLAQSLSEIASC